MKSYDSSSKHRAWEYPVLILRSLWLEPCIFLKTSPATMDTREIMDDKG